MNLTSESNAAAPARGRLTFAGVRWGWKTLGDLLVYAVSILFAIMFIFPTLWMVSSSFKSLSQIYQVPVVWIPQPLAWENYSNALAAMPFDRYMLNSLLIVTLTTIGTAFSSALVAYGFARFRAPECTARAG